MKTEFKPILWSLKRYSHSTKPYKPIDFEKERIKRELIHNQASMLLKVYGHKQQLLNIEA